MTEFLHVNLARPGSGKTIYLPEVPTREDALAAVALLMRCSRADLDKWTEGIWPDGGTSRALFALASIKASEGA